MAAWDDKEFMDGKILGCYFKHARTSRVKIILGRICVHHHRFQLEELLIMSGLEQVAVETACKLLCSKGAHDFFFKWQLDQSLLDRLQDKVKTTKDLLKVAEMREIQENSIGDEWFKKARFAICDAEDVLDKIFTDIQTEEYRMGDSPGTCLIVKEKLKYKGKDIVRSVHPFKKTMEAEMSEVIQKLESVEGDFWLQCLTPCDYLKHSNKNHSCPPGLGNQQGSRPETLEESHSGEVTYTILLHT
uniref:Disease resistance N-terminal domain-containing protein n=2 Tax=Kalanchoe fedtschenkoi TaxID=63787 RepID=A0A7N0RG65_KALFE